MFTYDAYLTLTLTLPQVATLVAVSSGVGWTWRDLFRAAKALRLDRSPERKRLK